MRKAQAERSRGGFLAELSLPSQGVLVYSIDVFVFFFHFSHKNCSRCS
jgi:hypothetical protein